MTVSIQEEDNRDWLAGHQSMHLKGFYSLDSERYFFCLNSIQCSQKAQQLIQQISWLQHAKEFTLNSTGVTLGIALAGDLSLAASAAFVSIVALPVFGFIAAVASAVLVCLLCFAVLHFMYMIKLYKLEKTLADPFDLSMFQNGLTHLLEMKFNFACKKIDFAFLTKFIPFVDGFRDDETIQKRALELLCNTLFNDLQEKLANPPSRAQVSKFCEDFMSADFSTQYLLNKHPFSKIYFDKLDFEYDPSVETSLHKLVKKDLQSATSESKHERNMQALLFVLENGYLNPIQERREKIQSLQRQINIPIIAPSLATERQRYYSALKETKRQTSLVPKLFERISKFRQQIACLALSGIKKKHHPLA